MTEKNTYYMEWIKEKWNHDGSYKVGYCRLTVVDASKKLRKKEIEDLFVAFKEEWFEEALKKFKDKYKKLRFQSEINGECEMKVIITNPKLKSFKK